MLNGCRWKDYEHKYCQNVVWLHEKLCVMHWFIPQCSPQWMPRMFPKRSVYWSVMKMYFTGHFWIQATGSKQSSHYQVFVTAFMYRRALLSPVKGPSGSKTSFPAGSLPFQQFCLKSQTCLLVWELCRRQECLLIQSCNISFTAAQASPVIKQQ